MGCGCAKKAANSRRKKRKIQEKKGNIIRKRRVNRLIAVPGRTSRGKNAASSNSESAPPEKPAEETEET